MNWQLLKNSWRFAPGALDAPKPQNPPHAQSVEAESFIQRLASRCACLPKEAGTTGMPDSNLRWIFKTNSPRLMPVYGTLSMSDPFVICIDRLKSGVVQKIDTSLSSDFFDIHEADLSFNDAVKVSGNAYAAGEDLVLNLNASTSAQMPCCICNRWVSLPLAIRDYFYTEPLTGISKPFFDFRNVLREALLIELPKIAECRGNCPEREMIAPFLRRETGRNVPTHYFPFNDLNLP